MAVSTPALEAPLVEAHLQSRDAAVTFAAGTERRDTRHGATAQCDTAKGHDGTVQQHGGSSAQECGASVRTTQRWHDVRPKLTVGRRLSLGFLEPW